MKVGKETMKKILADGTQIQMVFMEVCGDPSSVRLVVEDDVKDIVGEHARRDNYGMFRYWEIDGVEFYDCGPKTFKVYRA
jgi:hypothetical protein